MKNDVRTNEEGHHEVKTGVGWREVVNVDRVEDVHLPIIDIADINHISKERRRALAAEIYDAAVSSGFFYISNHGVPKEVIENIFKAAKTFFCDLTLSEKMEFDTVKHKHYYGYYPCRADHDLPGGGSFNESINYGYELSTDIESNLSYDNVDNWWPKEARLPGYQAAVRDYMAHMLILSRQLLRMVAIGIGLEEHALDAMVTQPYAILKMAHYPGRPTATGPPSSIRAHTDYELLTVLLQDEVPSLEVLLPSGRWIQVAPQPGTFVVNVGDSLTMLTNGLLRSTLHRAINHSQRDRFSVPYFFAANETAELVAFDSFVTAERPLKYQKITSGDYIRRSLQGIYPKADVPTLNATVELDS